MAYIPADRDTTFNPGVPGGIPNATTIHTTINASTYGNGVTSANAAIDAAIAAATAVYESTGVIQVVFLPIGVYRLTAGIFLQRGVVLRGAGPGQNGVGGTRLRNVTNGEMVIWTGWAEWPASAVNISGSVPVGSSTITVANASSFQPEDILQIDQLDDVNYVYLFDGVYGKRAPGWNNNGPVSAGGYRSVTSLHRVVSKVGNVLTIDPPTRIQYDAARSPQAWVVNSAATGLRWAGIEDLYITGGTNQGGIFLEPAAYCWVKHVESDGTGPSAEVNGPGNGHEGTHIQLAHSFRSTVTQCYVHHANSIVEGGGAYGINLNASCSECLVENNIAVCLGKAFQTNVSGGGNVFAYNYADNVKTSTGLWQEGALNGSHQCFSHHDLWEGNCGPNIGCDVTHGNSGFLIFFRNRALGRCSGAGYINQVQNLRAVSVDAWMRETTFLANVLEQPAANPIYEHTHHLQEYFPAIWRVGMGDRGGSGDDWDTMLTTPPPNQDAQAPNATFTTKALSKIFRHGNWDSVNNAIVDYQAGYDQTFPDSLYLPGKPSWWGSSPWPWVTPNQPTKVATLPAKARYDAGTPNDLSTGGGGNEDRVTIQSHNAGDRINLPLVLSGVTAIPGTTFAVRNKKTGEVLGTVTSDGSTGAWTFTVTHL